MLTGRIDSEEIVLCAVDGFVELDAEHSGIGVVDDPVQSQPFGGGEAPHVKGRLIAESRSGAGKGHEVRDSVLLVQREEERVLAGVVRPPVQKVFLGGEGDRIARVLGGVEEDPAEGRDEIGSVVAVGILCGEACIGRDGDRGSRGK